MPYFIRRKLRAAIFGCGALVLGTAGLALEASPAHAMKWPLQMSVTQRPWNRLVGFSQNAAGTAQLSRNVAVMIGGATPNGRVWFGVHDTTSADVNAWYGGWAVADSEGWVLDLNQPIDNNIDITGIPVSACGHLMRADATDQTTGVAVATQYFTDYCGPVLTFGIDGKMIGDGFSSGGEVDLSSSKGTQKVTASGLGNWLLFPNSSPHWWVTKLGGTFSSTLSVPCGSSYSAIDVVTNRTQVAYRPSCGPT